MNDLEETKRLLEEINAAVLGYDPILRERARDILLVKAFGSLPVVNPPEKGKNESPASSAPYNEWRDTGLKGLVDRWFPETIADLALLSAYHLQYIRGYRGMTGREIQINLKRHGLYLSNVSIAAGENEKVKPPRMKKRKIRGRRGNIYVVTTSGAMYVEDKLDGADRNVVEWQNASTAPKQKETSG